MSTITLSLRPSLARVLLPGVAILFSVLPFWVVPDPARAQDPTKEGDFAQLRRAMVKRDLRDRGIKDQKLLHAMSQVPRHLFVPKNVRALAYQDRPLPIGEHQTISQPYMVALMTELLELIGDEKVLEVGTGSGYQAAVLSHLAKEVFTVEILPSLAERAKENLGRLGYGNVQIKAGDGFFGWEEKGLFDAILVTASAHKVPEPLWRQLREGGRLVMPLGAVRQSQKLVRVRKIKGQRRVEEITDVVFVPMTGTIQKSNR